MANGWTLERRERQAALIRTWRPWERSTGPRTDEGKDRSSKNASIHGEYNQEARTRRQEINALMKDCKEQLRRMRQ